LTKETDPKLKDTLYTYDNANRVLTVKDALLRTMTYGYDLMSNLTSVTDDKGRVTTYLPDSFNRVKQITSPAAAVGQPQLTEQFEYDKLGRIKKFTDRALRETNYSYAANYLSRTITDPLNQNTVIEFNKRQHRTAVVDANNRRYDFMPDALGWVRFTT
jgi:YD repeat-containing protein